MRKVAVIGAGISGLTVARLLAESSRVKVFEKDARPGGLIKCREVDGSLFHTCGGHVFNTRDEETLCFFWSLFNRDDEFVKSDRNSVVFFDGDFHVPYPVENHAYCFDDSTLAKIVGDVAAMRADRSEPENFEEFLLKRFGRTLYDIYFGPYNRKIWRRPLNDVPLSWLEGKLPMPTPEEIIFNNIRRVTERKFVHSTFWYERHGGSQFIADRMAEGLDIDYNCDVDQLVALADGSWEICGEQFDKLVFCGNLKQLPCLIPGILPESYAEEISGLESHGTTAVFCEIDTNPYSWIYLPSGKYEAHRIICTGNFSSSNNSPSIASGRITATVEFTDYVGLDELMSQLSRMPLAPKYLSHHFSPCSYPIQNQNTRQMIAELKGFLATKGFFMTGRFADWEYYNMDAAMTAARRTVGELEKKR